MAKKIEKVKEYKSGVQVDIYLDTKTSMFSAEYADFSIYDKDGEKVKSAVLQAIRERTELKWVPVLWVYQEHNSTIEYGNGQPLPLEQHQSMGLRIDRFYAARKIDGYWVRANWNVPVEQRLNKTTGWRDMPKDAAEIRYTSSQGTFFSKANGTYILPYSDELWEGLMEVVRKMRMIREAVHGLLSSEEGMAQIVAIGSGNSLFLGSGNPDGK